MFANYAFEYALSLVLDPYTTIALTMLVVCIVAPIAIISTDRTTI